MKREVAGSVRAAGILLASALLGAGCAGGGAPRIVLVRGGAGVVGGADGAAGAKDAFEARGLDPGFLESPAARDVDWSGVLHVFVDPPAAPGGPGLPPVLGSARLEGRAVRFEPRYPLEPGLRYRAVLRAGPWLGKGGADGPAVEVAFAIPPRNLEPKTVVERVYPSAGTLPENQLKLYIHFSGPMRRGQAYSMVRLIDIEASGREVEAPFLELGEELWDPSGTRFTLFFDPGRLKRGLKPREEVGPPLEAGKRYALVIDGAWLDADGASLKEPFRKELTVAAPDYDVPDPRGWRIAAPPAGTREPLAVAFPEPLDHALLHRLLRVRGPSGAALEGGVAVGAEEREWRFVPDEPWEAGRHELLVETTLEDLAGNSVERPFEVDETRGIESRIEPKVVAVPFEVPREAAGR
ncbi:MAG: hypothetical protein HY721_17140 [Planctomycetes bacterium]|nr:hypothetical protein [Planctomycetota bacterium]